VADNADPYHVFGGLRTTAVDGRLAVPAGLPTVAGKSFMEEMDFGCFPDPADANYVYAESQGGESAA